MGTESREYAERLVRLQGRWWKRLLPVQAPYRWNLRRHHLGRTLDIGCGIGRNLPALDPSSVGVDHNERSVAVTRARGFEAYTGDEFFADLDQHRGRFDSLLLAHVIEHMQRAEAESLLRMYLPCLRPGGGVLMICPQERGYASDETHVAWTTGSDLQALARAVGLEPERWTSFPLPRAAGKFFLYNEFNLLATKPV